ncbi:hypothetical protein EV426DRAFT_598086 [Tirmania nivea]|nr:hypothetical protein EV426DRAFT_598086 [Tirmania nivea]
MSTSLYRQTLISEQKGYGMIATTAIPPGTVILTEAPLFQYPSSSSTHIPLSVLNKYITDAVFKLPKEKQGVFLALHCAQSKATSLAPPFLAICITNAFGLGGTGSQSGIFEIASRFNHSCLPNAHHVWKQERGVMEVTATSDIPEGTEITMSYLALSEFFRPHKARQGILEERYGFRCDCGACAGPEVQARDKRRAQISRMDDEVGGGILIATNPARAMKFCRQIIRLLPLERLEGEVPRVYFDAFQLAIAHGDQARASAFMKVQRRLRRQLEGNDAADMTPEFNALVEQPQSHYVFQAVSRRWQSTVSMRREEGSIGFDEWLWMRAET